MRYLRAGGIGPTDRVAVALPNGPEAAAAVLGTVAAAACAPLAPDLPEAEFANQLTTLGVRAVMVLRGHETAARAAASSCGIPVIEVDAGETAGSIACSGLSPGDAASRRAADTARGLAVVHLGHDGFPEARPAHRTQSADVGGQRRGDTPTRADRSMPERDAALPHPRARRRPFRFARRRRQRRLHRGFPRARRSRVDRGVPTDLVHRGPDHPPSDVAGGAVERRQGPRAAGDLPVRALVVGGAADRRAGRPRGSLRRPGDRGLRNDRGRAPDDEQSAPRPGPQTRNRGQGRRSRRRRARREGTRPPCRARRARSPSRVHR